MHAFETARHVVRTLRSNGHEALLAGGCVRDRLLGFEPKDYDVATSAGPETVMALFPRNHPVGVRFGVVIVLVDAQAIEVATFRSDGDYRDGRHPESVRFSSPEEDAARRDFTINALFLDPDTDEVIDHVGGRADLEARRLRTVGDAAERFAEDHLRMLRAVRFAARFALEVDPAIPAAARARAAAIREVARERITEELTRIASGPHPDRALALLDAFGLREQVVPAVDAGPARRALLAALPGPRSPALGLAGWVYGLSADARGATLDSLRLSRKLREQIDSRVEIAAGAARWGAMDLAARKRLARSEGFDEAMVLAAAAAGDDVGAREAVARARRESAGWNPPDLAPVLPLDGDQLVGLGVVRGPAVGRCLRELEDEMLRGAVVSASDARRWAAAWIEQRAEEEG